ncbi:biopolymer transporter ExbD [Microvenator marinus]|jgi:biopolymer transport protein ExbD|uniref:Biopolymer transporter ExbD n=1 Tax=Microvenator marinus TaxID=2600177 RepID=A0A5B8XK36_9DELT|nr:biopolymer transporter ExbD [Microvenator marinus]QED26150.1 biopolymer transporter ExbD [Microvenator marinus]
MAGFNTDDEDVIAAINVTPLVDIILVVLIIFMVTTSIIVREQIEVDLPKAATGSSTAATPMVIQVLPDGTYKLSGEVTTLDAIGEWAKAEKAKDPDVRAIVAADRAVKYEHVVDVIDTIKINGVEKFALNIEKKK